MHEFDAGDPRCRSAKALEAGHRSKPKLDRSVMLLSQIVEVFGRLNLTLTFWKNVRREPRWPRDAKPDNRRA